jgi:DNA polymerase phi
MKSIFGRVQSEPETAVEVLGGFINSNGNISFDIQTKTKTVEKLLAQADDTSVKAMTTMFSELLLHPGTTEEKAAAASRQVIADYLLSAIRSRPLPEEPGPSSEVNSNVDMILSTFVEHAYFLIQQTSVEPHKLPAPPISDTSREMFKSRISSSLTHLMAKSSNTSYYPYTVLATIRLREQNTDGTMLPLMSSSGNVVSKSIDRAWKAIEKIHTKVVAATDARKEYLRAFELLFSLTALQVYNGNADAASMLEELQECYKTLVKHKSSAAQGEGSEILVEILLSLVSKPSLLFRRLAQQVFSVCTHLINENGLKSMLSVSITVLLKWYSLTLVRCWKRKRRFLAKMKFLTRYMTKVQILKCLMRVWRDWMPRRVTRKIVATLIRTAWEKLMEQKKTMSMRKNLQHLMQNLLPLSELDERMMTWQ